METLAKRRLHRIRGAMADWGADILVFNFGPDFLYLTGMEGPMYYNILKGFGDWITCAIVSQDHDPVIVLHPWFNVEVKSWVEDVRVMPHERHDPQAFIAGVLAEFAPAGKTIAVGKMVWSETLLGLQQAAPSARFIPATNAMMDHLRRHKDPEEITTLQEAARITDLSLAESVKRMKVGMTERDLQLEVEHQIRLIGGDGPSFSCGIISVGNGTDPNRHIFTRNTAQRLLPGMTVAFDYGVIYKGHCTDFGRSVFIGDPRRDALNAYTAITTGNRALMPMMKAGVITPTGLADAMQRHVDGYGCGEHYMYGGLGHAIGLEVHEEPWLKPPYDQPIEEKMVFTLEPKVWKPGIFYVRCEDMVVVEKDGAWPLTLAPYEPAVVS